MEDDDDLRRMFRNALAQTRNIPVVDVTGQQAPTQTEGMACLLRKPVAPDRLVNTVRGCILASRPELT